ncbi:MAG: hypothetical protein F6K35_42525, partial [Okeania sp. SIO2H7]|nr:hypothetical protein [Okeania sp. SIO2H7]
QELIRQITGVIHRQLKTPSGPALPATPSSPSTMNRAATTSSATDGGDSDLTTPGVLETNDESNEQ